MSWRMIGKPFLTAEMTGTPVITERFRLAALSRDALLKAVQLGVIFYANPAFTSVYVELWSDRGGSPIRKLATSSTSYAKAVCLTTGTSAYRFMGFAFSTAEPLKAGTYYHIVLRASGYTGNSASHIAWRHSYPDPQYQSGVTRNAAKAAKHPFELAFVTVDA